MDDEALRRVQRRTDRVGAIHRLVDTIQREQADLIAMHFPKLNRCLTGYGQPPSGTRRGAST